MLSLIFLIAGCFFLPSDSSTLEGTVYYTNGTYSVTFGKLDKEGVVYGKFDDNIDTNGWGELNIVSTGADVQDSVLMHAAGFLEGSLTTSRIYQHITNVYSAFLRDFIDEAGMKEAKNWFAEQDAWARMQFTLRKKDPFWQRVGLVFAQFDGLVEGYQSNCKKEEFLEKFHFQFINGDGDMLDLSNIFDPSKRPNWDKMDKKTLFSFFASRGHCSALIKVLDGYENIFAGHATWFFYPAMLRVYKHYNLQMKDHESPVTLMSFSSYPGALESQDDFYMMDNNVVLLQTTNSIFNYELYDLVVPQSLLSWQRMRVANMMSDTGEKWAEIFQRYNSGTYNNQYMLLDMKKIHLDRTLENGALWVVEQIPGLVVSGDQTAILRKGYWPSYNVPFYEVIYNMSGYPEFVEQHGVEFSYEMAPRAKIFRRDQSTVTDLDSLKHILRYNEYKTDPYSNGDPTASICSRGDLADPPSAAGCNDCKVTDFDMAKDMKADAINGPTTQNQPVFQWAGSPIEDYSHLGQPNEFNFTFVTMKGMPGSSRLGGMSTKGMEKKEVKTEY